MDPAPGRRQSRPAPPPASAKSPAPYRGPATIADGVNEGLHDVEIHTVIGENAASSAWHVNIKSRLDRDLRYPSGKTVSVTLPDGRHGLGILVDLQLIKGTGEPPS